MHLTRDIEVDRRFPIGAEVLDDGVHCRVWAPKHHRVELVLAEHPSAREVARLPMVREGDGYFSVLARDAKVGMRYGFWLRSQQVFPDPASRFQPDGPAGLSQIIDPHGFRWSDGGWKGRSALGQVIYEMHIGTFTSEGTFDSATREFAELARIGITMIEVM